MRRSKEISAEKASQSLGITRPTLNSRESGKSKWRFDEVCKLCELYGITTDEFKELTA